MISITLDKAIELAKAEIAKEGEDFVYEWRTQENGTTSCMYVYDGKPDCLVGRILHSLGVSLHELSKHEGSSSYEVMENLDADGVLSPTFDAIEFLRILQAHQDQDESWGESLRLATQHGKA